MGTLNHLACTVVWVARHSSSCLSTGEGNLNFLCEKSHWGNTVVKKVKDFGWQYNLRLGPGVYRKLAVSQSLRKPTHDVPLHRKDPNTQEGAVNSTQQCADPR